MTTIQNKTAIWSKLEKSKAYRTAFVASTLKRWLPFQIRVIRERRGWNQTQLAKASGLTQGAISRAENPDYGDLSLNTLLRIASGLDCAFEGRFVPFSRLATQFANMSEGAANVPPFDVDNEFVNGTTYGSALLSPAGTESRLASVVSSDVESPVVIRLPLTTIDLSQ